MCAIVDRKLFLKDDRIAHKCAEGLSFIDVITEFFCDNPVRGNENFPVLFSVFHQAAFDAICSLDEKGQSYVFEVSRNPTKLYDCMAQLLSHPLQRPLQKDTNYSIEEKPGNVIV